MKEFTVVLLYPHSLTGDFGADVNVTCVKAEDEFEAGLKAQQNAAEEHYGEDPENFRLVLVFEGSHDVLMNALEFESERALRALEAHGAQG